MKKLLTILGLMLGLTTLSVAAEKEIKVGRDRYFLHFSKDNKRILIHTRQLSNSFSRELIPAIVKETKKFLK